MTAPSEPEALRADWLGASRRAAAAVRAILREVPTTAQRAEETGTRGEGGDRTLVIDERAEDAVFAELDALHAAGARFTAISEERGTVDFGSTDVLVIVDPIDGSLNAKRGLPHHALSIAVADGPTLGDVAFGYVHDFGPGEEWTARRGAGAAVDGRPLDRAPRERRSSQGALEVIGLEMSDPRWLHQRSAALAAVAYRVRALGTIAVTLAQLADARIDGMLTLKGCRAVDSAAGALLVREAGGLVGSPGTDALAAPLDLVARAPLVAARTERGLAELLAVHDVTGV